MDQSPPGSQGLTVILHALSLAHSTMPLEVLVKQNFHVVGAQDSGKFCDVVGYDTRQPLTESSDAPLTNTIC